MTSHMLVRIVSGDAATSAAAVVHSSNELKCLTQEYRQSGQSDVAMAAENC